MEDTFYITAEDKETAERFILAEAGKYSRPIVVDVKKESRFWDAEEYHQNYLIKNPQGYCHVDLNLIKEEEIKPHLDLEKILESN